jgi:glycosyltransferase involved in cell wall biosynthesis
LEPKPIHLLLVSNTDRGPFLGGADRDWVNLLNALGPDHLRVTWVANSGSEELRKYIDPRVLVRTIDIVHPSFYDLVPDNAYTPKSKWLWTKIMMASSLGLGRSFIQLRHAMRSDPVDIVVTNTVVVLLGALFAKLTRRPHVWNIKEYLDPQVKACRRFANVIMRFSSAVVVPSRVIGEAFSSRLHVLPDGGDIENIKARVSSSREDVLKALGLPLELPMVAQVGAISQRKGQHVTAEAFMRLAHRGGPPPFSLVFFGKGNTEETGRLNLILSQAPQAWRAVVKFAVFEEGDLSPFAAADIVVHPSTFQDAFPNAVREAMTLGKPVIASALGGMLDMIVDGVNGLLVKPDDANALASALDRLLLMPDLARQLGASAALFARDNFDIHLRKLAFLDLLNQLATSKRELAAGASE